MDYLFIRKAKTKEQYATEYLLVEQDDMSHMIRLTPASSACSVIAAQALLKWSSTFGIPSVLVTDGGSHFLNKTIGELTKILGSIITLRPHIAHGLTERRKIPTR